jgi:hypothetical protein
MPDSSVPTSFGAMRAGARDALRAGLRDALRSILAIGHYDAEPMRLKQRAVGNPSTDRRARYRDMHAFRQDVPPLDTQVVHGQ